MVIFKSIPKSLLFICLGLAAVIALGVAVFMITMPEPTDIAGCITTKMYSVRLCEKDNRYVLLRDISPFLKDIVVIAEDSSFYSHDGFDWFEIKNSLKANLRELGYARGGSTITQQLAKNVFLTGDKSILRKVREAYLALHIEKLLPKKKILEKYLNVIEFGRDLYGIKAASRHYFSKHPSELHLLESAFLAYLLPNPKTYSKVFNRGLTDFARFRILDLSYKMYRYHRITEDQYRAAKEYVDQFPWSNLSEIQLARLNGVTPPDDLITDFVSAEPEALVEDAPVEGPPEEVPPPADDEADEVTDEDENTSVMTEDAGAPTEDITFDN